jgi:hypothetical protein
MPPDPHIHEVTLNGAYEANNYEQNFPVLAEAIRFHGRCIALAGFLVMVGFISAAGIIAGGLG